MQLPATVKDREGAELSILDVVVHSCRAVIKTLTESDRIGIVTYSDRAQTVLPLTVMDGIGKSEAEEGLSKLRADGQTNLWDGLHTGLEMLRSGERSGSMASVLLLTDGVPNVEPAGGHLAALEDYRRTGGGKLPCALHTFGFGYELDSHLLDDLACMGGGLYVFIPDAGFVGTALVNCSANAVTAAGHNAELVLHLEGTVRLEHCFGYPVQQEADGVCRIHLGSIQLGQTKDVVLRVAGPSTGKLLRVELSYDGPDEFGHAEAEVWASEMPVSAECRIQCCRLQLVEVLSGLLQSERAEASGASAFLEELRRIQGEVEDDRLAGIVDDVSGQVAEAVSRQDWYESWGKHYLRSLSRAHLAQLCNNFKDPGVQPYGGDLFREVRDAADDIFLTIPAPNPAAFDNVEALKALGFEEAEVRRALDYAYNDASTAATFLLEGFPVHRPPPAHGAGSPSPTAVDMSVYYDASGG